MSKQRVARIGVYLQAMFPPLVLIPASVVILGLVLFGFFRSLAGVALPLSVTGITLVFTLGIYKLSGLALNTMTSLLPPVLMVLSVMTSVHLYDRWLERRGQTWARTLLWGWLGATAITFAAAFAG